MKSSTCFALYQSMTKPIKNQDKTYDLSYLVDKHSESRTSGSWKGCWKSGDSLMIYTDKLEFTGPLF